MLACAQLYERFVTRGHQEDTHFVCRTSIATSADFHRTSFGHLLSSERKCTTTRPHHVFMRSCVHASLCNPLPLSHRGKSSAQSALHPAGRPCPDLRRPRRPQMPPDGLKTASYRGKTSAQPTSHPTHRPPPKQNLAPTHNPPHSQLPREANPRPNRRSAHSQPLSEAYSRPNRATASLKAPQRGKTSAASRKRPSYHSPAKQIHDSTEETPHSPPVNGANPRPNP